MKGLAQTSVTELKGVGAKAAEKLAKLAIVSVQDLLFHLPHRYEDRTRIYPISELQPHLHTSIQGEVMSCDIQFGRKRMLVARLSDGTGTVTLRFFHFSAAQKSNLEVMKRSISSSFIVFVLTNYLRRDVTLFTCILVIEDYEITS